MHKKTGTGIHATAWRLYLGTPTSSSARAVRDGNGRWRLYPLSPIFFNRTAAAENKTTTNSDTQQAKTPYHAVAGAFIANKKRKKYRKNAKKKCQKMSRNDEKIITKERVLKG